MNQRSGSHRRHQHSMATVAREHVGWRERRDHHAAASEATPGGMGGEGIKNAPELAH
jgi:hypothetical protein